MRLAILAFLLSTTALAQGITVKGGATSNLAAVNTNLQLEVHEPSTVSQAGYVNLAAGPQSKAISSFGPMGRLAVGTTSLDMFDPIDGTVLNTNIWSSSATTMTIAQNTSGFIVLNATSITTVSTNASISSIKQMQLINTFVPTVRMLFKTPNVPQSNATMELGFGNISAATPPTDGCYFRWNKSGIFEAVSTFGSVDTSSGALTAPTVNATHTSHIVFRGTGCEFWIDDAKVAQVNNPAGNSAPTSTSRVPVFARVYTEAGTPPVLAPELWLAAVSLFRNDLMSNKSWPMQMEGIGRAAYQSPVTTFAQTTNHANSTGPVSATLSNTAAGYTTLGGRYQFAAPAGAVTDFALFAYQVPAGYQFFVKQVRITACNTGAAVATTPTVLDWALGFNSSAVSLATADGTGTWAPRRLPLGMHGFVVGDLVGRCLPDITVTPGDDVLGVVDSNRFFHVIVAVPFGTATASQVIRGDVLVSGWFE